MEVIKLRRDLGLHAFLVHLTRSVDRFTQSVVKIGRVPSFINLLLVIKFYLRNQKPGESSSFIMETSLVVRNLDRKIDVSIA